MGLNEGFWVVFHFPFWCFENVAEHARIDFIFPIFGVCEESVLDLPLLLFLLPLSFFLFFFGSLEGRYARF